MKKHISKLFEQVDSSLLAEGKYSLVVMNEDSVTYEQEIATKLNNPYDFDISSFLPNVENMNLEKFYSLASELIEHAQEKAGVIENERVILTEEYPPERLDHFGDEVICFRLLKREPANMNSKASGRPHRKSTFYYDYDQIGRAHV